MAYPGLIRLGSAHGDGGYVVPDREVRTARFLLSLGLSDEWSFDEAFLRANPQAKLIGVDHTIGPLFFVGRFFSSLLKIVFYALTLNRDKLRKWRRRLAASTRYFALFAEPHRHIARRVAADGDPRAIGVDEIFALAQPASGRDVFLKMDIEGSEYQVIADIVRHRDRIGCLAAEFHDLERDPSAFNDAMRALGEHFAVVHVHGNNFRPYDAANDFPTVVEITFVNRSLFDGTPHPRAARYPLEGLDVPNNARKADYELNFD